MIGMKSYKKQFRVQQHRQLIVTFNFSLNSAIDRSRSCLFSASSCSLLSHWQQTKSQAQEVHDKMQLRRRAGTCAGVWLLRYCENVCARGIRQDNCDKFAA